MTERDGHSGLASEPRGEAWPHPIGTDVIDCIELPIVVLNRACTVVGFNPAAASLLSLEPSQSNCPLRSIPLLADVKDLQEACEHVMRGGTSPQWELRDAAGSWFSLRVGPCKAANQNITGAVLSLTNVTAFRASLEQAITEREHTKAIVNAVIDPLVVLDGELCVQAANQAFYEMFQASRDGIRGIRIDALGKTWGTSELHAFLSKTTSTDGRLETLEIDHEFPGVGRRTLLLTARRLAGGRGHFQHMILLAMQDITERERAEQARVQLVEELQQTVHHNEIFAGILAHDLRSPLAAILLAAEALSRRDEDPMGRILSNAERMVRMIEQLLDFTRARTGGGIAIEPNPTDLRSLATQLVEELEGAGRQPIVLTSKGDTCGQWDRDRLAQVISNLLANAIQHGEPESIRLSLDGGESGIVRIVVSNAGVIPARLLPTLFDPFREAKTGRKGRKSEGLGLGLFITERIVSAHGGTVSVTSTAEAGTTFVVQLPRRADTRSAALGGRRGDAVSGSRVSRARRR